MLLALTDTALQRRWSPAVYIRLSAQLGVAAESSEEACSTLLDLVESSDEDALLFDYIYHAAVEPKSVIDMRDLITRWAAQSQEEWSDKSRNLMIFVARGLNAWKPSNEVASRVIAVLPGLVDQAIKNREEALFFISQLTLKGPLDQLSRASPSWRAEFERQVHSAVENYKDTIQGRIWTAMLKQFDLSRPVREEAPMVDKHFTPSRTSRLLWLDYTVHNMLNLDNNVLRDQIEILWPNERLSSLVFELTLTAFDAMASALYQNSISVTQWESFLVKKLPLVYSDMTSKAVDDQPRLDSAITRLLTAMDKDLVAILDQNLNHEGISSEPIRITFCKSCIDLGLCDAAVLHVLHQDYKPQHAIVDTVLSVPILQLAQKMLQQDPEHVSMQASLIFQLMNQFSKMAPRVQQAVAKEILRLVSNNDPLLLKHISRLCATLLARPEACDQLLMHIPIRRFLKAIIERTDDAAQRNASAPSIYADCGCIAVYLGVCMRRYGITSECLAGGNSWVLSLAQQMVPFGMSGNQTAVQLEPDQDQLLGAWVNGIVGTRGVSGEMLKSPKDFFAIFPVLTRQIIYAHQVGVLNFNLLKGSIAYFTQPFLLSAVCVPLSVIHDNLWMSRDVPASCEVLRLIIDAMSMLASRVEHKGVLAGAAPLLRKLSAWTQKFPASSPILDRAGSLIEQAACWYTEPANLSGSLEQQTTEAVKALAQWQRQPLGIPQPSRSLFCQAKSALGPEKLCLVVEQALDNSEVDTEVLFAVLLVHGTGLWKSPIDNPPLLVDCFGQAAITEIVRNYAERFKPIFEESVTRENAMSFDLPLEVEFDRSATQVPMAQSEFDFTQNDMDLDLDMNMHTGLDEIDNAINFDMWE